MKFKADKPTLCRLPLTTPGKKGSKYNNVHNYTLYIYSVRLPRVSCFLRSNHQATDKSYGYIKDIQI